MQASNSHKFLPKFISRYSLFFDDFSNSISSFELNSGQHFHQTIQGNNLLLFLYGQSFNPWMPKRNSELFFHNHSRNLNIALFWLNRMKIHHIYEFLILYHFTAFWNSTKWRIKETSNWSFREVFTNLVNLCVKIYTFSILRIFLKPMTVSI